MKLTRPELWRKLIYWLRSTFPHPDRDITVRAVNIPDKYWDSTGYTDIINGNFRIVIHKKSVFATRIDTLIHEWAHTLTWNSEEDHNYKWGIAYSKIYRGYLLWRDENGYW